jgi:hypothetical protein
MVATAMVRIKAAIAETAMVDALVLLPSPETEVTIPHTDDIALALAREIDLVIIDIGLGPTPGLLFDLDLASIVHTRTAILAT